MTRPTTIWIQPDAPRKPVLGASCNGCGVCCLAEPCPLGVWLSRRRHGACAALHWDAAAQSYRCGPLARWLAAEAAASQAWTGLQGLRRWGGWLRWQWARLAVRWTVRQISAGAGCDSDAEVAPASGLGAEAPREAGQAVEGAGRPVP